jgi:hypothetical protein
LNAYVSKLRSFDIAGVGGAGVVKEPKSCPIWLRVANGDGAVRVLPQAPEVPELDDARHELKI